MQLTAIARDSDAVSRQTANTATVTVNVYRNTFAPAFVNEATYSRAVRQDIPVDTSVTQVTATDADRIVSVHISLYHFQFFTLYLNYIFLLL